MTSITTTPEAVTPRLGMILLLSWLVPGGGHFLLKKHYRGALIAASVLIMFTLGLLMRGYMFEPQTGDVLTIIIYVGGFIADVASGIPYILTKMFGYVQPDVAGHVHDYGTKFLVAAGLFNILGMVDAWEIALRKKD